MPRDKSVYTTTMAMSPEHKAFIKKLKKEYGRQTDAGTLAMIIDRFRDGFKFEDEKTPKEKAYERRHEWNIQTESLSDEDYKCEVCSIEGIRYRPDRSLVRHHHYGYEGENANRVQLICRKCHGIAHRDEIYELEWSDAIPKIHKRLQEILEEEREYKERKEKEKKELRAQINTKRNNTMDK